MGHSVMLPLAYGFCLAGFFQLSFPELLYASLVFVGCQVFNIMTFVKGSGTFTDINLALSRRNFLWDFSISITLSGLDLCGFLSPV